MRLTVEAKLVFTALLFTFIVGSSIWLHRNMPMPVIDHLCGRCEELR